MTTTIQIMHKKNDPTNAIAVANSFDEWFNLLQDHSDPIISKGYVHTTNLKGQGVLLDMPDAQIKEEIQKISSAVADSAVSILLK